MADETTPKSDVPVDDKTTTPQEEQKQPGGLSKAVLAVGDWLNKPVKNKVDGYAYKNNGQMIAGRTSTAFEWGVDSISRPIEEAANAFGSGKIEDLYINVPFAIADQLLKILDGLNNWLKNIERHPELGQIKDNEDVTRNLSGNANNSQTKNLSKPENTGSQTTNIPPAQQKTDQQTTNIPPAQQQTRQTEKDTKNIPAPQTTSEKLKDSITNTASTAGKVTGEAVKQTGNVVQGAGKAVETTGSAVKTTGTLTKGAGQTTHFAGKATETLGKAISKGSEALGKAADVATQTLASTKFGAPLAAVTATVKGASVVGQGAGKGIEATGKVEQQAGKTLEKVGEAEQKVGDGIKKSGQTITETGKTVSNTGDGIKAASEAIKQPQQPTQKNIQAPQRPINTVNGQTPTKNQSTSVSGLKLNEVQGKLKGMTLSAIDKAKQTITQSRTARDNANQCKQLGNKLAAAKNKNKPRTPTPNRGLTLGNRGMSMA